MKALKSYQKRYKTIKMLVLSLTYISLLGSLSSCNESTSAPPNNQGSTQSNSTQNQVPVNLGPTGATDPITNDDVNGVEEVTYYDQADPSNEEELPGTPYNSCGAVYRQFNNPTIFFRNESNQIYSLKEFSYDSVTFLRNIRFNNDSFDVCLEGYRNGGDVFLNLVTQQQATAHPLKLHTGQFGTELCGNLAYVTNPNGQTTLNLQIDQFYYLIGKTDDMIMLPAGIPYTTTSITDQNSVEACLYSNEAPFKDFSVSFKPQFNIEAFDLGALNP